VLGIEPAANVARVAVDRGVPTMTTMFRTEVARELAAAEAGPISCAAPTFLPR